MISNDTIVAPASPFGVGGISVIRLSGSVSKQIATALSRQDLLQPNLAVFSVLHDENGHAFDQAVVTNFQAPNSYTGEDVVEISCHGNPLLVQKIVDLCISHGARISDPGEFTLRAFANGKMDLIQAESVSGLIHSQTTEAAYLNYHILQGQLSKTFHQIKKRLLNLVSSVEYFIDVSEDELHENDIQNIFNVFPPLKDELENLLQSYNSGRLLTEGANVVLIGEPNVGKSTLLNALSDSDRAITSPTPGTTRDSVDVQLNLGGIPVRLVDTAGLRTSNDQIEQEGIRRTDDAISHADLVLYIVAPNVEISPDIIESLTSPFIILHNKTDLQSPPDNEELYPVSALSGKGVSSLKAQIINRLVSTSVKTKHIALTTARQHRAVKDCLGFIRSAQRHISMTSFESELVAFELRNAISSLDIVLGKTTPDDILNNIFGQFCVGK